jgi:hypothetical protein
MKLTIFNSIGLVVALVGAIGSTAQAAQWASVHGSNRGSAGPAMRSAPAPRPAPAPAFRAPTPAASPSFHETPVRTVPAPHEEPVVHQQEQPMIKEQPPVVHEQPHTEPFRPVEPAHPAEPNNHGDQGHPFVAPTPAGQPHTEPAHVQPGHGGIDADHARTQEMDRRRMDIDGERHQSYFWSDYHRGMRVDHLPHGFHRFDWRGRPYFFFEGVFYDQDPGGYYDVVDAPVDADVPELPPGAESVVVNGTVYYYAGGAFYVQQADGQYVVVAPPMGVTVSELPPDATPVSVNGYTYYQSNGTYYEPVEQNGVTVYETVPQP